jgi:uncharacterized protein (DUF2267 family)
MESADRKEVIRQTAAEARRIPTTTAVEAFLRTIEQSGTLPPDVSANEAATAVACVLAQRLSLEQGRQFFAALPSDVRSALGSCAAHQHLQGETFGAERLVQLVGAHFPAAAPDPEALVRVVFLALRRHMAEPVAEKIEAQLPRDLAEMWLQP